MINFTNVALRRGGKLLFEKVTFTIHRGQRAGVTGVNGCGKSSLFAMVRDKLHSDAGELTLPPNQVIAHVAQETPELDRSAIDYAIDGDVELRTIEAELVEAEAADDGNRQAQLHAKLESVDGYTCRSRAARLLHGLGFTTAQEGLPVKSFSGGWRMRLNLAQALMCRSDILLLDEPTNHLDLDAVMWLQAWLSQYQGTLLLISHDRDFLDDVTTHIAHVEQGGIELYTGNYSAFEKRRAERLAQQQSAYVKQQEEIAHIHSFVTRFKAKASKAKQAQSRLKTLERMEMISAAHIDSPFNFSFLTPEKLPHMLLQLRNAEVGYGDKTILANVKLDLASGDRVGLLGANGAGKSTLIKVLADTLAPRSGDFTKAQDLKIGYFAQHQLEQLHLDESPLEHLLRLNPRARDQELRDFLGGFAFNGDKVTDPVAPFSGGEKARLVLAMLVYQRPNLLLLDEPTNHLDLEMRHALSVALQGFEGALVMISHDRHMLRSVTDRWLWVDDGCVTPFDGDLESYRQQMIARREADESDAPADLQSVGAAGENSQVGRKARRQQDAEQRRALKPLQNKLKKLEQQMDRLNTQKDQIEDQLAGSEIYEETEKARLKTVLADQANVSAELDQVESEWMEISESLEAITD